MVDHPTRLDSAVGPGSRQGLVSSKNLLDSLSFFGPTDKEPDSFLPVDDGHRN